MGSSLSLYKYLDRLILMACGISVDCNTIAVFLGGGLPGFISEQYTISLRCRTLAERLECSPMVRETWVRSQVESYQRLKKWYLMPPCLTLSIIRYGSRVKWSNPGKWVAPSPTPWCSKLSKREPSGHPRLWSPTFTCVVVSSFFL